MRTLLFLISLLSIAVAHAGQTVFGSTSAQTCYNQSTVAPQRSDTAACDDAINKGNLTRVDLAATYSNRGIILSNTGQLDRAIEDHDAAVKLNPTSARAYVNRANTLFRAHRYEEALADYDHAIELSAGSLAAAFYNRSFVHLALAQKDAAREDLEHAAALAPEVQTYRDALQTAP
jgi:tetratricopeptide (TPR) repeat protein